jgi:chromosome partitioning protein
MILAVANVKGGVGKTTLAVNLTIWLARQGCDVLLIDGDEQRTAAAFTELRAEHKQNVGYTAIELREGAIKTQCRLLKAKYDHIVIDVGGQDSGSLRAALVVAETVLIPVQPRSFDLWAIDQMADLINDARQINENLRALAFLNQADPQGKDNGESFEYISKVPGLELGPAVIRRKVYPNAAAVGLSIFELEDADQREATAKAREDLSGLIGLLFNQGIYKKALAEAATGGKQCR